MRGEFDEIRLVLSNHSHDAEVLGNIVVRPTSKPCGTWAGGVALSDEAEVSGAHLSIASNASVAFEFDEAAVVLDGERAFKVRSSSYTYRELQTKIDCRTLSTASGPMHPATDVLDSSDGAATGNLTTAVSTSGTPIYYQPSLSVWTTMTTVSNCNDLHEDQTTVAQSFLQLWMADGVYDIKKGGFLMQETIGKPDGLGGTVTQDWHLTKQSK